MTTTTQTRQDEKTTEFLSGKLAQVDIARIERELKELWRSASNSEADEKALAVTRACAMNLILYSEKQNAETVASDMLDEITVRHPCRAILAINRPNEQESLEAWVSARCHLTGSKKDKQICCEQITVRSEGQSTKELASVVMPLLLPDLPVFMWLNTTTVSFETLAPFLPSIDRLIVDSADIDDNLVFFEEVAKVIEQGKPKRNDLRVIVSDLNWNRSLSWRESIALSFEERYGKLSPEHLSKIQSVEITYGLDSGAARLGLTNQSLLVVSWLATRLGWKLKSASFAKDGKGEIDFGSVKAVLTPVSSEHAGEGDIGSITIKLNDPPNAVLRASQAKGMPGIGVFCCKDGGIDTNVDATTLELYEPAESVVVDREFEQLDRDPIFCQAVLQVVPILAKLHGSK